MGYLHRLPGPWVQHPFSFIAVLVINLNFSYPTRLAHSYLPDPLFRVYVDSIHKAKVFSESNLVDRRFR